MYDYTLHIKTIIFYIYKIIFYIYINLKMNFVQLINIYIIRTIVRQHSHEDLIDETALYATFDLFNLLLVCIFTKNND